MCRPRTSLNRAGLQGIIARLLFIVLLPLPMLAFVAGGDQASEEASGIKLLSEETREEAIACGKRGAECAVTPYLLCPSNPRYSVRLATPYSRIAFAVYEAQRRHRQARPPSRGAANHWGVGLYVSPANDSEKADSIERVFIRRANEAIQPMTVTLAPVFVDRADGSKVQLSKGFFAFPMDAFRPLSAITLAFIGPSGEVNCTLDQRKLSNLR